MLVKYSNIVANNWNPPDQDIIAYYAKTSQHYLQNHEVILMLSICDGIPVSTIEMFPTDSETIGFYGFATLEEFRGRGIGSDLFLSALYKAKDLGYKQVVLQASADGIGIYRNLGFKEYGSYVEYQPE